MAVMAPVSGFSLAALMRFTTALPLPSGAAAATNQSRLPDVVVFSSAPLRLLSDLASAGLQTLATLLPLIEQAVQQDSAMPLAHLVKAAGAAARQIGDGHDALLAEGPDRVAAALQRQTLPLSLPAATPASEAQRSLRALARLIGAEAEPLSTGRLSEPLRTVARQIGAAGEQPDLPNKLVPDTGPIQRWIAEAKHLLRSTGDALERAEQKLQVPATTDPVGQAEAPQTAWLHAEIQAAQAQIAAAYAAVSQPRSTGRLGLRVAPRPLPLDHLAKATTLLGMLLVLATLWLVGGLWSAVAGGAALGGTVIWVWRLSQATKGVTLDARG